MGQEPLWVHGGGQEQDRCSPHLLGVHSRGAEARFTLNKYIISPMNVTKEKVLDSPAQENQSKSAYR